MELLIFEYSDGVLIRVKLNEELEKCYDEDPDEFVLKLSRRYNFRMNDIYWMTTREKDEVHDLAEEMALGR